MAASNASSKVLDVLHKTLVSGVVLGTCVIGADLINRYFTVRQRRIEWEKQNPELVSEFYASKKNEKAVELEARQEEKRKKTEELFAVMRARGEIDQIPDSNQSASTNGTSDVTQNSTQS